MRVIDEAMRLAATRIRDAKANYREILSRGATPQPGDAEKLVDAMKLLGLDFDDARIDARAIAENVRMQRQMKEADELLETAKTQQRETASTLSRLGQPVTLAAKLELWEAEEAAKNAVAQLENARSHHEETKARAEALKKMHPRAGGMGMTMKPTMKTRAARAMKTKIADVIAVSGPAAKHMHRVVDKAARPTPKRVHRVLTEGGGRAVTRIGVHRGQ